MQVGSLLPVLALVVAGPALAEPPDDGRCAFWDSKDTAAWREEFETKRQRWKEIEVTNSEIVRWRRDHAYLQPDSFYDDQVALYVRTDKYNELYGQASEHLALISALSSPSRVQSRYDAFEVAEDGSVTGRNADVLEKIETRLQWTTDYEMLRDSLRRASQWWCAPDDLDAEFLSFEAEKAWEEDLRYNRDSIR